MPPKAPKRISTKKPAGKRPKKDGEPFGNGVVAADTPASEAQGAEEITPNVGEAPGESTVAAPPESDESPRVSEQTPADEATGGERPEPAGETRARRRD